MLDNAWDIRRIKHPHCSLNLPCIRQGRQRAPLIVSNVINPKWCKALLRQHNAIWLEKGDTNSITTSTIWHLATAEANAINLTKLTLFQYEKKCALCTWTDPIIIDLLKISKTHQDALDQSVLRHSKRRCCCCLRVGSMPPPPFSSRFISYYPWPWFGIKSVLHNLFPFAASPSIVTFQKLMQT